MKSREREVKVLPPLCFFYTLYSTTQDFPYPKITKDCLLMKINCLLVVQLKPTGLVFLDLCKVIQFCQKMEMYALTYLLLAATTITLGF